MTARISFATVLMMISVSGLAGHANADDTGFASSHSWRKEGGRTCFAEHTHYGSSAGLANKKIATTEAIKSWAGFTAWEYGTDWANFNKAAGKQIKCSQGASGWGCEIEARPCR
jgi:hypothetical protein